MFKPRDFMVLLTAVSLVSFAAGHGQPWLMVEIIWPSMFLYIIGRTA